jgi:hypothetical protein
MVAIDVVDSILLDSMSFEGRYYYSEKTVVVVVVVVVDDEDDDWTTYSIKSASTARFPFLDVICASAKG